MTDNEVRQLMASLSDLRVAFGRLEEKVDGLKEDIDELKDWRDKILMIVVSTVIVGLIGLLFGTGVVRL